MINRERAKVRFVKCPKCANILQEPEQCPLYACGGCETILQAKYYSGDHKPTKSGTLEQSLIRSNSEGHASDDGESNGSGQISTSPGEESTDQNRSMDKNDALLSEESTFLHNQGNGSIESKTGLDRNDHEANQNREHLEATSEGTSMIVLENKDTEQHGNRTNVPEILQQIDTHREVTGSLEVAPKSLTKGSLTYDGSVSSLDGNDHNQAALEQHENIVEDSLPGNGAVAGHVGAEESPEWSNDPSSRIYRSSRIQSQMKNSSQARLNGKLKSAMLEEEELVGENRERFPVKVPFYQSSEVGYETGSSSSYIHDELPPRTHHHRYRYEDPEQWVGNLYNYETSREVYHRYHNHIDRRWRRESRYQSGGFPSMPYSDDGPNGRYQMGDPYMHRHPDVDFWWSPQVAAPVYGVYGRQGLYAPPSREVEWDPYDSGPPQSMEYEHYHWARKGQTMRRLYSKERRQTMRKYFCPIAGGAPFVTCNVCFNVLQLPDDFLASRSSRSGTHRVRCGGCSEILVFTLDNTSTLAPCKPNANPGSNTNSRDHVSHSQGSEKSKVDPENYGDIERERGSENAVGSSGQTKEMKVNRKLPDKKSPLHRLMGYSSPNVLLDGHQNEEAE